MICKSCGIELEKGARYCPSCGHEVGAEEVVDKKNDILECKIYCVLCYIWILFFIPLIKDDKSKFCRFHANQALVLLIATALSSIVIYFAGLVFAFIGLGMLFSLLSVVVSILGFILMIIGMINASQGEMKELPVIGKIELIKYK